MVIVIANQMESAASTPTTSACKIPVIKPESNQRGQLPFCHARRVRFAHRAEIQVPVAPLRAAHSSAKIRNGLRFNGPANATIAGMRASTKPQRAPAASRRLRVELCITPL